MDHQRKSPTPATSVVGDAANVDATNPVDSQARVLEQYHRYLESHYEHGVDRFFAPTGFLRKFEKTIEVAAEKKRDAVYVKDMEDATAKLQPVVAGGEGVYDLIAEPGTGKTTVLPFKFPSSKVVVALPTPFDAWSAFNTATGPASLRLKGLKLGKNTNVCYMDSYLAANMVLSGFVDYDVLIVDECDSGKGVTRFLADVRAPGKVLIRMSASHGRVNNGTSKRFNVATIEDMPDVREGVDPVAEYVSSNAKGRSLVLAPDAETASKLHQLLPGSKLVSSKVNLGELSRFVLEQIDDGIFVSDDVCARGLNLNLDMVFDCQLVAEHAVIRHVTDVELYQRKGRVGRSRPGSYHCPGLRVVEPMESDADLMRSNVVKAVVGVQQHGPDRVKVTAGVATDLLHVEKEPFAVVLAEQQARDRERLVASRRQSVDSGGSHRRRRPETPESVAITSSSSSPSSPSHELVVERAVPDFMLWGMKQTGKEYGKTTVRVVRDSRGRRGVERRTSSTSSSDDNVVSLRELQRVGRRSGALAPISPARGDVALDAPYAVTPVVRPEPERIKVVSARAPPVMDLSISAYEFEWPALLSDLIDRCGDLPTIVPPGNWKHTSLGSIGSNWLNRLEGIAIGEHTFTSDEFEVVCRAWNLMVASTWVRRTPGLSQDAHANKMEFCLRYFQMYYQIASAG